jgi:hypothetical protein
MLSSMHVAWSKHAIFMTFTFVIVSALPPLTFSPHLLKPMDFSLFPKIRSKPNLELNSG